MVKCSTRCPRIKAAGASPRRSCLLPRFVLAARRPLTSASRTITIMTALTSNEIEAANRAEVTTILIRGGHRVYRPEADVSGEDLVIRTPDGELLPVQMKGRPTVDRLRYGNRG